MRFIFLVLLFLNALVLPGQEFRFRHYRVGDGLPGDIVKAITQDEHGYFWIATDDGLVQYDGVQFKTYTSSFQSQYIKSLHKTASGRLLVVADLDLSEIIHTTDTIYIKSLMKGARNATDTTLWYPKEVYEDKQRQLWLAEPQSVTRLDGRSIRRYDFGLENRSPLFTRSYYFLEDDEGGLYTISVQGKIFKYDAKQDAFAPMQAKLPFGVNYIQKKKNHFLAATDGGIFEIELTPSLQIRKIFDIKNANHLLISDSITWIATSDADLYWVNDGDEALHKINFKFDRIEQVYQSMEGDLWLSTQRGIVLAQRNIFQSADALSQNEFVEAISEDSSSGAMYYCVREDLVALKQGKRQVIYHNREGYFQSLLCYEGSIYASNDFSILKFRNDRLVREWNFEKEGRFIHDISIDNNGNLWLSQSSNQNAIQIDGITGEIQRYRVPILPGSNINAVRSGPEGLYAASNGRQGYLFFKTHHDTVFTNVSKPLNFEPKSDFNVTDLVLLGNNLWLATSEGLLAYTENEIKRIDLGDLFTGVPVNSIEPFDSASFLFSSAYGLFRYDITTNEYWLFDEASGLPSNTITGRGIFVDARKRIWVGTSLGLAVAELPNGRSNTKSPRLVKALVNGKNCSFKNNRIEAPHNSLIALFFSSITFPESKIIMQWREPAKDSSWRSMKYNELVLSEMATGIHMLEIRAKKNTGQGWSSPFLISVHIGRPFWMNINFAMFFMITTAFIAMASYAVANHFANQRKRYLESLVKKSTEQLQLANDELTLRNTELDRFVYSASHDLSAPLKSVRGLINVTRLEKPSPTTEQYLTMMEQTIMKLEHFISEVVSHSRNARMEVKNQTINFEETVKAVLEDHRFHPDYKLFQFVITDHSTKPFITDVMRLKIVLSNLISNAIKFHRAKEVMPQVEIKLEEESAGWKVSVSDNGRGIANEHLQHIFTMFYRAHDHATGSGLGLYIMKEAIEKMGGRVQVESLVGKGTTFLVFLPMK